MRVIGFFTRATLLLLGVWLLSFLFLPPGVIDMDAPVYDPAIESELRGRSADYGGVDRWVFPGIDAGLLAHRVTAAGFACKPIEDLEVGGTPKGGVHPQTCTRVQGFPLSREIVVQAQVDFDHGRRVTSVKAYTVDASDSAVVKTWARILRRLRMIEPAELRVTGLTFSSSADLARYVVDAINPRGWSVLCDHESLDVGCRYLNEQRQARGFPQLPREPLNPELLALLRSLDAIGIRPPSLTSPRGDAPIRFDEAIPVRVDGWDLWVDASGPDFAGAERQVSIRVAPEGGRPLGLGIRQGGDEQVDVALVGVARKTGTNQAFLLLVDARSPDEEVQTARWVVPGRTEGVLWGDRQ